MLNWHFKLFLTTLYLSVSFAASFDFVLDHQFCIMRRDLCMLVVIVVVVVALRCIANSFSIHFHLISRIDVIVCMLLCHCHHTPIAIGNFTFTHEHAHTYTPHIRSHTANQRNWNARLDQKHRDRSFVRLFVVANQSIMEHVWMKAKLKETKTFKESLAKTHWLPQLLNQRHSQPIAMCSEKSRAHTHTH